ncbi:MAG: DUF2384 domain-containing protein [Treponema sp.]|nr:DUF2384 domain-containing protein [Treponema sp.]
MQVAVLLGQKKSSFYSPMDYYRCSQSGITKKAIINLSKNTNLPISYITTLANINIRTLQRKTENDKLSSEISEKILQIAQVFAKGTEVFNSLESFKEWLESPNISLDGAIPANLISSNYGTQMVLDCLGRIQYGVYS